VARGVLNSDEWDQEDLEDDGSPFGFHIVAPEDDVYLDTDPMFDAEPFPYDPFPEEG
jgi:hypothetical protein